MANRFTNTSKWQDDWFLSLTNDYRIIWQYLNDNCSIVGVWKKGVKHLNYFCNTSITEDDLKNIFSGKIIDCGEYFFIPSFLKEQYPGKLNEKSGKPIIQGVFKEIRALNLFSIIKESLGDDFLIIKESLDNDCTIIKERVTGKGKGKRKQETEKGGVGEKTVFEKIKVGEKPELMPTFEQFWNEYDKKVDRPKSEQKWNALPQVEKEKIMAYLPRYKLATPDKKFRRDPTTFLNNKSWENEIITNGKSASGNPDWLTVAADGEEFLRKQGLA